MKKKKEFLVLENSIAARMFAFHAADPELILRITYGALSLPEVTSEHRYRSNL